MSFVESSSATINLKNLLVLLPVIAMQARTMSNNRYPNSFIELQTAQRSVITPLQQVMVPVGGQVNYAPTIGAMEASPVIERRDALLVSPLLVTFTEEKTTLKISSPHFQTYTLDNCVALANFKMMTAQQAAITEPVPQIHVLLKSSHPEEFEHNLSQ